VDAETLIVAVGSLALGAAIVTAVRVRAQAQRHRDATALATRLAALGGLSHSITHELNQSLGAILTNADAAELLLESEPAQTEELLRIVRDIRSDGLRTKQATQRISSLLRHRAMTPERIDLDQLVHDVRCLLSAEAARHAVCIDVQSCAGAFARGDPAFVQQALLNLLMNSIEASAERPSGARRVIVRVERPSTDSIEVSVVDSGAGVAESVRRRMFDWFYTTKRNGLGLGLPVARMLIEAHGGTLHAHNDAATGGATISMLLPASR
jgi:C4-dicarboxylate-specific signal transduction histidine kinase